LVIECCKFLLCWFFYFSSFISLSAVNMTKNCMKPRKWWLRTFLGSIKNYPTKLSNTKLCVPATQIPVTVFKHKVCVARNTNLVRVCDEDLALPTLTWKDRPLIKEKINLARKISQPRWRSLCSSALCQTESNAFLTSRINIPVHNLTLLVPPAIEFRESLTILTTLLNWCAAEWAVRNPNWWFGKTLFAVIKFCKRYNITLSNFC
jgi:hypothetical protein